MSDWIIFESLFIFAVWMQRKHRWAIFGQAMSGKYTVGGSVRAGSQAFQYTAANDGTVSAVSGVGSPTTGGGGPSPSGTGNTSGAPANPYTGQLYQPPGSGLGWIWDGHSWKALTEAPS